MASGTALIADQLRLADVLTVANASERGSTQQAAEQQLTAWESQPGFHLLLQSVYNDLSLPLQVRWLAVISFKNGIEKHWRASRKNSISREEKIQIKERVFELVDEPNKQLAIQNAQAIARICRYDFPQEWPSLFDQIEDLLQSAVKQENNIKIHNILLILNQIIKNLATAKIGRTRPALQSKVPIITPLLIKLYTVFLKEWIENLDFAVMEIGYLALKILKRLIVDVYDTPSHVIQLSEFIGQTVQHFQLLVQNYDRYAPSEILGKYIKCYNKIYFQMARANPTDLILLPCSKEILYTLLNILQTKAPAVYSNTSDDEGEDSIWEFLAIKTLLIFKMLIKFLFKKGAVLTLKSKSSKIEIESAIQLLTNQFFTEALIKDLVDLLINYYIKLRPKDLESWVLEPEEWANDEVNQNYEYQVRQCAENVFQDLVSHFKELLVPYILNKVQNELNEYDSISVKNILIKDSVFSIFQLSANSVYESIDINSLLNDIFFPESLKNDLVESKILKRRVCLLINEWFGLNVITQENNKKIYSLLLDFLNPANPINDKVVNLTTIQVLKTILTDWDFKKEEFKDFINPFMNHLFRLIDEMQLTESKLFIFNTIAELINRTNPLISSTELDSLLPLVAKHWDSSNNTYELILKNSLLRILKNLVISLDDKSEITWEITLPLIKVSCSPNSEYYSILSEEGYELWLSILQFYPFHTEQQNNHSTNVLTANLDNIYMNALLNQTEILPLILEILRSYILLTPEYFTSDQNKPMVLEILRTLTNYIGNMRDDSFDILISTLEIWILQSYETLEKFQHLLSLFMESEFLTKIVSLIIDPDQSPITAGKLLLIISRISYFEPSSLLQVFHYIYSDEQEFMRNFQNFINIWFARMDSNIGNPRNRKSHILGLTSLLRIGNKVICANLAVLLSLWMSALEEINEADGGDSEKYHSNYLYEFQYYEDLRIQENGEFLRFQQLIKSNDPIHNIVLKDYLHDSLITLKNNIGETNFQDLMNGIDENLLENVQYFLHHLNQKNNTA